MNELKIQVESKDDINFVVRNLKTFTLQKLQSQLTASHREDLFEACRSKIEEKLDAIIGSVASNIQVNGLDWSPFSDSTEEFEPLDESLQQKLTQYENSIEGILYRGIQHRQSYPMLIENEFEKVRKRVNQVMHDEFEQENQTKNNVQMFKDSQDTKSKLLSRHVSDRCLNDLQSSNTILDQLYKSLPALVAKMNRAKTVLQEESKSIRMTGAVQPEEMEMTATEEEEDEEEADNTADLKELNTRKKIQLTQLMVRKISQATD